MNNTNSPDLSATLWDRICLAAGYLVLALMGIRTVSNSDGWSHLAAGKAMALAGLKSPDPLSFTTEGAAGVNHSWLYDLIMYKLHAGTGMVGVTLFHVIAVVGAFLLVGHIARRRASGTAIGMSLVLASWILAPRFEVRPEMMALLFSALFMFTASEFKNIWTGWGVLIPLQILWANTSATYLLGPLIAAAFAVGFWKQSQVEHGQVDRRELGRRGGLAGVLLLVSALNPYGPRLIIDTLVGAFDKSGIYLYYFISPISTEFNFGLSFWILNASMALGLFGFMAFRGKLPLSLTILAIFAAVTPSAGKFVGINSVSLLDQYALLAFPFFCLSFQAVGKYLGQRAEDLLRVSPPLPTRAGQGLVALVALVSIGSIVSNGYYVRAGHLSGFGLGANLEITPEQVLPQLDADPVQKRMLNLPMDGGYLALQAENIQVFSDQRQGIRDYAFYESFYEAISSPEPEAWKALEEKWNPQLILVNACSREATPLLRKCLTTKKWGLVYFDGTSVLLATRTPENLPLFSNREFQDAGFEKIAASFQAYQKALGGAVNAPIPARLVGAAEVLLVLNQLPPALTLYRHLTAGAPAMRSAWLNRGLCEIGLEQYDAAALTLQQASKLMPENARVWVNLGLAYSQQGKEPLSEAAYARAASLNPEFTESFRKQRQEAKRVKSS